MKRFLILMMMVLLTFSVFAEGQAEEEKPIIFAIVNDYPAAKVHDADFEGWLYKDRIVAPFTAATGIEVTIRKYTDATDNTAKSLDMDLASGDSSDVILSYGGRVNKFANADFGVNLYEALPQEFIDQFAPSALKQFERNGELFTLPMPGWATCMMVNVDLFEEAGVTDILPADDDPDRSWTIAEFDRAVKAVTALGDEYYGYYLIAKECGGDYWIMNMLGGFGAKLYEDGKVALNCPAGIEGMEYIHYLHENGYVPYGASGLFDGDMASLYFTGKLGTRGYVPMGADAGEISFKDGKNDKPFKSILMEYPHIEGVVDGVPPCYGPDATMVIDNGDPVRLAKALKFIEWLAGADSQSVIAKSFAKFSPLTTVITEREPGPIGTAKAQMAQIIKGRGIYDMGVGFPVYNELRQIWLAVFQGMLTNAITPKEAVEEFERRGNKLLSE